MSQQELLPSPAFTPPPPKYYKPKVSSNFSFLYAFSPDNRKHLLIWLYLFVWLFCLTITWEKSTPPPHHSPPPQLTVNRLWTMLILLGSPTGIWNIFLISVNPEHCVHNFSMTTTTKQWFLRLFPSWISYLSLFHLFEPPPTSPPKRKEKKKFWLSLIEGKLL